MNTDLRLPAISLHHGHTHQVKDGKGLRVACLTGTLWLTQQDDRRDIVLEAGDVATIERDGLSLLTALADAQFVLLYGLQ